MTYKRVLTIAGSDPSGGAGIQADLKTMSACGCFGMSAITAVVDENTVSVFGVHPIPDEFVHGQITSVLDDIGADAIKIGMLHSSSLIRTVKKALSKYDISNIVLDPVMVATSGDKLLQDEAIDTLKNDLIPDARIITPNIPEAEILLGQNIERASDIKAAAKLLANTCNISVLLKAGHLDSEELTDVLYNIETGDFAEFPVSKIDTKNTHGTGCTLSSAIASYLAHGLGLNEAVLKAKEYISSAIAAGAQYEIGKGHGPVHHFHQYWM